MKISRAVDIGLSFGLASGVITTLGLMVGLNAGTHSKLVVIGGILTIAIADAFSDALGIHMSQESENRSTDVEVWTSTVATFIFKFIFASTFILPVLLFPLDTAVLVSVGWGLLLLAIYSYYMAKKSGMSPFEVIGEHVFIAFVVVILTNFVGNWIAATFA